MNKFNAIGEIKVYNAEKGFFFFERDTMRFFRSRIAPGVYHHGEYVNLFITSEQFDDSAPRLYTVRQIRENGGIDDIGKFQQYASLADARRAITTGEAFIGLTRETEETPPVKPTYDELARLVRIAHEVFKAQSDPEHCAHNAINWERIAEDFGKTLQNIATE